MRTPYWVTARNEHIQLSAMTTMHILAALDYLRTGSGVYGPMTRPGCSGFTNPEWEHLFRTELTKRSRAGLL
jgi:hypothetical protein